MKTTPQVWLGSIRHGRDPRTGVGSVVREDVIRGRVDIPSKVGGTCSGSPKGSDHVHESPENVVGNESDIERGTLQLAFQRLDSVNLRDEL